MKELVVNSMVNYITKYEYYSKKDVNRLRYGLEGIYLTLTKLIIIFLMSVILRSFKETLIVLILFNVIRYFGFGFHAGKSWQCLLLSIFNFIFIPLIFKNLQLSLKANIIIGIICTIIFLIFAPADTVKRPLVTAKKRFIRKILTVATSISYIIIMMLANSQYLSNLIISSLIIMVILVSPITYWLFGQPYNNYKKIK